jgi:hypothetical protein
MTLDVAVCFAGICAALTLLAFRDRRRDCRIADLLTAADRLYYRDNEGRTHTGFTAIRVVQNESAEEFNELKAAFKQYEGRLQKDRHAERQRLFEEREEFNTLRADVVIQAGIIERLSKLVESSGYDMTGWQAVTDIDARVDQLEAVCDKRIRKYRKRKATP